MSDIKNNDNIENEVPEEKGAYRRICLEELDYLVNAAKKTPSDVDQLISEYVPDKVNRTLNKAFSKAFETILKGGTGIIGATLLDKEQKSAEEAIRKSKITGMFDTAFTFAEGAAMGIVGLGLPDIPVFTGMVFRNIYQKAAFYGFDYESETEKVYMLKLISGALAKGRDVEKLSLEVDKLAREIDEEGVVFFGFRNEDIEEASDALANDMLYMKFVQGIPIVGAVGGLFNAATMGKISKYAEIKYHKRSLIKSGDNK